MLGRGIGFFFRTFNILGYLAKQSSKLGTCFNCTDCSGSQWSAGFKTSAIGVLHELYKWGCIPGSMVSFASIEVARSTLCTVLVSLCRVYKYRPQTTYPDMVQTPTSSSKCKALFSNLSLSVLHNTPLVLIHCDAAQGGT